MARERVMWKIWHPMSHCAWAFSNYWQAQAAMWSLGISNWRCDPIVPKEATERMALAAIDRPADPDAIMYCPIYRAMLAAAPHPFPEDKP